MKFIKRFKYEILVILIFVLSRLPGLGHDVFNTDVWKWKSRTYDFSTGIFTLDFGKTYQKYHPGVTLMWLGTVGIKIQTLYREVLTNTPVSALESIFELHTIQKGLVVIAIGIGLGFCFYVLRSLFGLKYAFLSIFLLSFEPFYIGLTRTFHLEGLVATFMLASVLWLYYFLQDKKYKKRLVISGIFGGLALLTKTSALYLLPFTALIVFLDGYKKGKFWSGFKSSFLLILKWVGLALAVFIILWPALWVNPVGVISELYRGIATIGVERDHIQIYFERLVEDPGPTFYPVVLALKSSVFLIPGLVGSLVFARLLSEDKRKFLKFLLIYSFFFLVQLTIPSKKLDRYILPSLVSLSLVSSIFYYFVWSSLEKGKKCLWIFLIATPLITAFTVHPDYFSYFNPVFGGLKTGIQVLEPKWMIGQREVLSYFNKVKLEDGKEDVSSDTSLEELVDTEGIKKILVVGFPEKYYTQIWPFFDVNGMRAVIKDLTPFAIHSDYFVYPVWEDDSFQEDRFKIEYIGSIKKDNVALYNVYKRIKE